MAQTAVIYHPDFELHDTGNSHPETRSRARIIYDFIKNSDINHELAWLKPEPVDLRWIKKIHGVDYINHVENACLSGENIIDQGDTKACPASFEIARLAAGAAIKGVDHVMNNEFKNAFCCCRPPGHHAEVDTALGFCLFNNIAILARYLQKQYGLDKIAIIDWDVHHGNGTQHAFEADPSVLYVSTHQYPFYPGTGAASEQGVGRGKGSVVNCPMPAGATDSLYRLAFAERIIPALERFAPEAILISAGFDAHAEDPLAEVQLSTDAFTWMTQQLLEVADRHAEGRVISLLEGGYNLSRLGECVATHLNELRRIGQP